MQMFAELSHIRNLNHYGIPSEIGLIFGTGHLRKIIQYSKQ